MDVNNMEDEWLPQNEYESSEEEVDIDEVKKELFEKVQNIKQTLSENFNIDILKNNLRYMKDNIKLKNYQVEGVNWILNIFKNNVNGILGLGKTIQTICALAYMKHIYNNWIEEVKKFSNLTVFQFNGNKFQRNKIKEDIMNHEYEFLKHFKFECLVVDEAHRIKNKRTVLHERLKN
ncbi:hypothetical protein LY90DRAFT_499753 [Neocallimastix californiae]|uniref:SNF2 N-terminal domain-containing protein n=1 Tax=Neocallimastix californiae TaxID=1754190 RepID=A0A1Y2FFU0_9FUNG|nr:hypothetical protein LY90DRAFT_499753 [Neocallimastix californiae]|eukprot:ORY82789.1 hypothetical protein LY90DRAFT_499753 [Neocallimastix californiae]